MKRLFFIVLLFNYGLHAQDTIRFRSGEVKVVKVREVGLDEIKFNRFDNLEGPQYVVNKSSVHLIKYSGGQIDSFPLIKKEEAQPVIPAQRIVSEPPPTGCEKLVLQRNYKIVCNDVALSEKKIQTTLMSLPESEKKSRLMKVHAEMKGYQKKQYQYGFGGLIALAAAPTIGFVATVFSGSATPYLGGLAIGGAVGITGAIISKQYKNKRMNKRLEIVKIYNE
jgi:hypothetical protein